MTTGQNSNNLRISMLLESYKIVNSNLIELTEKVNNIFTGGDSNLYYTDTKFDTRLATKSTDDISEGSNLYYTDTRVDNRIGNTSIDALSDVNTTGAVSGNILKYDSTNSKWVVGNESNVTYSAGTGISINGSNEISINQGAAFNLTNLTSTTQPPVNNTTKVATTQFVHTAIDNLLDSAPGTLDTLNELALALDNDANFAASVTTNLATKLNISDFSTKFNTDFNSKTTNDISEGNTNLYYTDTRVDNRIGNTSIGSLWDVNTTGAAVGNILKYDSTNSKWVVGNEIVISSNKIALASPLVEIVNTGIANTHFNSGSSNYINGTLNWISSLGGGLHLDTYGTGQTDSGVRIKNRTATGTSFSDTIFNYANIGANYIRGENFDVDVLSILLNGTNNGVEIKNGGGFNSTFFNFGNNGENYLTGINFYINSASLIELKATGTAAATSGVKIKNGVGSDTIFNHQNSASNFIHGTTRFFNDIHIHANLNFDRLNNDTANIRFTSSTQNISINSPTGNHSPFIRVGDIEPTGRHGFDFKFRDWTYNNQNWTEFTLFRAYGNTNGNGQFQVFGATYSAQGWNTSDDRFKHGEYNIANGLETIRNLVPQTYKKTIKMLDADNDGTNIGIEGEDWYWESGLIAQEIEKIPTLSKYVKELDNKKYVSYNNIHIHTISAVKELDTIVQQQAQFIEQQAQLNEQQAQLNEQQAQLISSLEARLLALESK